MLAMQYTIELPSGYDEAPIRERVSRRARLFDELGGLHHKSFLFNAADGLYAPFYIWDNEEAARDFLMNDLFSGVIDSFHRPRVRNWNVIRVIDGNRDLIPSYCLQEVDNIPSDTSLQSLMLSEVELQKDLSTNPDLYFHAIALDPDRWELVRYSIWKNRAAAITSGADCVQDYEVLHVSDSRLPAEATLRATG